MDKKIVPNLKVEDTLKRWPETVSVFLKYKMACVGCTMASFESLSNAAEIYHLPLNTFLEELQEAVDPE